MRGEHHPAHIEDRAHNDHALEFEPTPAWIAATMGLSLEDADWLFILYVAQRSDGSAGSSARYRYFCEPV
ncbi:hypothetical protein ACN2C7_17050 [Caulobacter sp. ErkDOM-E]|uniref:hypothetical protein n=1 Tax=Caulobacter sp. ErkDOM-E TaxID=3402778 RepID=UPI003AF609B6